MSIVTITIQDVGDDGDVNVQGNFNPAPHVSRPESKAQVIGATALLLTHLLNLGDEEGPLLTEEDFGL